MLWHNMLFTAITRPAYLLVINENMYIPTFCKYTFKLVWMEKIRQLIKWFKIKPHEEHYNTMTKNNGNVFHVAVFYLLPTSVELQKFVKFDVYSARHKTYTWSTH
jgi:hypothetical protein